MFDEVRTALQKSLDDAGFENSYPVHELHHCLTSDQERDVSESLTLREIRRKPQTSSPSSDDGGPDSSEPAGYAS
jgi:hypothetical protein